MGVIDRCSIGTRSTIALELIKSGESADADQIERFYVEAKAAANWIMRESSRFTKSERLVINTSLAMAFVDDDSLWEKAEESSSPPQVCRRSRRQHVAEAIQYAHDPGEVASIAIETAEHPAESKESISQKSTDFALAKCQGIELSLTETGTGLDAESPHAARTSTGKSQGDWPAGRRLSLGATLSRLLTGRPPILADTTGNNAAGDRTGTRSPRSSNEAVSVDLETIVRRLERIRRSDTCRWHAGRGFESAISRANRLWLGRCVDWNVS